MRLQREVRVVAAVPKAVLQLVPSDRLRRAGPERTRRRNETAIETDAIVCADQRPSLAVRRIARDEVLDAQQRQQIHADRPTRRFRYAFEGRPRPLRGPADHVREAGVISAEDPSGSTHPGNAQRDEIAAVYRAVAGREDSPTPCE